ncbi:hypothetical protein EV183_004625 [Coemansia sp. RSA 2336]|nr:hypothetical protein EV183_004625 [Coemansia sp. RSA 2336]
MSGGDSHNRWIGSIHVLKRRPQSDQALQLLQKVAAQVRPVMQKRGWKVPVLREFYPRTQSLLGLNVNHGAEIRIRLRSPHDDRHFLAYGDLVGTMLHELVHIEHGPHDRHFYALLDEIKAETEELMMQGYAGDGFYSAGQRVGQGQSHNVPRHMVREHRLRALEKRQRIAMLSGPPRTLGSKQELEKQYTPAQMAARALERRLHDESWCGERTCAAEPLDSDDDVVAVESDDLIVISDSEPDVDVILVERRSSSQATDETKSSPTVSNDDTLADWGSEPAEDLGPAPTDEEIDDVDGLFARLSIAEVRRYEQRLQKHIEETRRQMRRVTGAHYPELIDAADSVTAMRETAADIKSRLGQLQSMLEQTRKTSTPPQKQQLKQHATSPAGNSNDTQVYAVAAQVKVLVDAPEQIWKALSHKRSLQAALQFQIAQEIHSQLCAQSRAVAGALDPLAAFPVIERQWASVAPFVDQITASAHATLEAADASFDASSSAVCAIALLEEVDAEMACTLFLARRAQTLQPALDRMETPSKASDAAVLGNALKEILGRVRQILADYTALFGLARENKGKYASWILTTLASICADAELPQAPLSQSSVEDTKAKRRSQLRSVSARRRKSSLAGMVLSSTLPASPITDTFSFDDVRGRPPLAHSGSTQLSTMRDSTAQPYSGVFMAAKYLPEEISQFRPRLPRIMDSCMLPPDGDILDEADEDAADLESLLADPARLHQILATRAQPGLERIAAHALALWWQDTCNAVKDIAEQAIAHHVQSVADAVSISTSVRNWERDEAQTWMNGREWIYDEVVAKAAASGALYEQVLEPLLSQRAQTLLGAAIEQALLVPEKFLQSANLSDTLAGSLPWHGLMAADDSTSVAALRTDVRAGLDFVPTAARAMGTSVERALCLSWSDAEAWWQQMGGAVVGSEASASVEHLVQRWHEMALRLEQWSEQAAQQAYQTIAASEQSVRDGSVAEMPAEVVQCLKGVWAMRALADVSQQLGAANSTLLREGWKQQQAEVDRAAKRLREAGSSLLQPWLVHLGSSAAQSWAAQFGNLYFAIPAALACDSDATHQNVVQAWRASSPPGSWAARYAKLRRVAEAGTGPKAALGASPQIRVLAAQLDMRIQAVVGLNSLPTTRADLKRSICAALLHTLDTAVGSQKSSEEWDCAQLAADVRFMLGHLGCSSSPLLQLSADAVHLNAWVQPVIG